MCHFSASPFWRPRGVYFHSYLFCHVVTRAIYLGTPCGSYLICQKPVVQTMWICWLVNSLFIIQMLCVMFSVAYPQTATAALLNGSLQLLYISFYIDVLYIIYQYMPLKECVLPTIFHGIAYTEITFIFGKLQNCKHFGSTL